MTAHRPHRLAGVPIASPVVGAPVTLTADASKMSGLAFMDATGLSSPEKRAERIHRDRQACIRAIRNGDTRGFPPMFVDDCRRIMAEQPDFDQVDWAQAVRSAYAMPKGGAL
jgi:hypothetical protein